VNPSRTLVQRGFYYMHIVADPKSPDVVYVMNVEFGKSVDGGRTFSRIRPPHGDKPRAVDRPGKYRSHDREQ